MARFLSDEWIAELDAAAQASTALADLFAGEDDIDELIVQHVVTDDEGEGDTAFHLVLGRGPARAVAGPAPDPTVTFVQDRATAVAISSGAASAQAAFMAGRLRLGGRVDVLLTHHGALTDVDDMFAEVRARTEWS